MVAQYPTEKNLNNKNTMKFPILVYIVSCMATLALLFFCFFCSPLSEFNSAMVSVETYTYTTVAIFLNLFVAYISLKLFALPHIISLLKKNKYNRFINRSTLTILRIILVTILALSDFTIYATQGNRSFLWLGAIMSVVLAFCAPRKQRFS